MAVLVVYDTSYGNTAKIAEAVASACGGIIQRYSAIDPLSLPETGLLIVGSPTEGGRPTTALQLWLDSIRPGALSTWRVAAFDTRFSARSAPVWLRLLMRLIGYAGPRILVALEAKGGTSIADPEGFVVDTRQGPLHPGEVERARGWGRSLTKRLPGVGDFEAAPVQQGSTIINAKQLHRSVLVTPGLSSSDRSYAGGKMPQAFDEPSAASNPAQVEDEVYEADLERVLQTVPRGAVVLCGLAVGLMLVAWLAVYFGVFIPRGPIS